jgi:hypothetical protein
MGNAANLVKVFADRITNALKTIEYEHHEIHDGRSFVIDDLRNINSGSENWLIVVPDSDRLPHLIFEFVCTGEFLVNVQEGVNRNGVTELTAINRSRGSANTAETKIYRGVTGVSTGTNILNRREGSTGTNGKTESGGGARANNEFILKRNTKYLVTVTTYADVYVNAIFDWYEHDAKGM